MKLLFQSKMVCFLPDLLPTIIITLHKNIIELCSIGIISICYTYNYSKRVVLIITSSTCRKSVAIIIVKWFVCLFVFVKALHMNTTGHLARLVPA